MGAADTLERELPYLRRYARAVTGSGERGDALVEEAIRTLLDGRHADLRRLDLFSGVDAELGALGASTPTDEISALSNDARRALLLTAMEGFSRGDAAEIMRRDSSDIAGLIADAERGLTETLATQIFIIEDEPLVAAHIAQIARELGHEVLGQAVTRDEAVAACLKARPSLLLADIHLADGSSGADAAADITAVLDIPVIFVTAYPHRLLTGTRGEPVFLIPKPFRPDMVKAVMSQALIQQSLRTTKK